jgi:hypothetical protein
MTMKVSFTYTLFIKLFSKKKAFPGFNEEKLNITHYLTSESTVIFNASSELVFAMSMS